MNMLKCTNRQYADLFAQAVRMGIADATGDLRVRTGAEILKGLGVTGWRNGHKKYLKTAYTAGRFQVDCMGED